MILRLKIDVTKIDKARLFEGKNGAKYLDATIFYKAETDQYGNNGMITQDVSQAERAAGVKGAILGNGKEVGTTVASKPTTKPAAGNNVSNADDDLPF